MVCVADTAPPGPLLSKFTDLQFPGINYGKLTDTDIDL